MLKSDLVLCLAQKTSVRNSMISHIEQYMFQLLQTSVDSPCFQKSLFSC